MRPDWFRCRDKIINLKTRCKLMQTMIFNYLEYRLKWNGWEFFICHCCFTCMQPFFSFNNLYSGSCLKLFFGSMDSRQARWSNRYNYYLIVVLIRIWTLKIQTFIDFYSDLDFLEIKKKSPISGVLDKYRKMIANGL